MTALREYAWPGNVRELQNVIERAVVMCDTSEIRLADLPPEFAELAADIHMTSFEKEVRDFKTRLIQRALAQTGYNKLQPARLLALVPPPPDRRVAHRLCNGLATRSGIRCVPGRAARFRRGVRQGRHDCGLLRSESGRANEWQSGCIIDARVPTEKGENMK